MYQFWVPKAYISSVSPGHLSILRSQTTYQFQVPRTGGALSLVCVGPQCTVLGNGCRVRQTGPFCPLVGLVIIAPNALAVPWAPNASTTKITTQKFVKNGIGQWIVRHPKNTTTQSSSAKTPMIWTCGEKDSLPIFTQCLPAWFEGKRKKGRPKLHWLDNINQGRPSTLK